MSTITEHNPRGAGRKKGSLSKPRITAHITDLEMRRIVAKAKTLALAGNERMIQFLAEQYYGKALQAMDVTSDGKELPVPIYAGISTKS